MGISKIGRYEIVRELGRGGMATVFLARDPAFERQVAIKVLPSQFTRDPQYLARFQREAKVIAAVEHPAIVAVYDYGEDGDQPYLVMRYMLGGTLWERMAGRPMPIGKVGIIITRLAEALDEAHEQGVVHRDLKPSNVLFDTRGQAYLSDFGIAKILAESNTGSLTGSGVLGTPAYMSPEQAMGDRAIDRRSDIYALGVIVYELLTGRHPYEADTPMRLLLKHISEPPPQLSGDMLQSLGLTDEVNLVLAQALAKRPDERYATATQLARPLASMATGAGQRQPSPPVVVPASPPVTAETVLRRETEPSGPSASSAPPWRWFLGGAMAVIGVALILAAGVWLGSNLGGGGDGRQTATATLRVTEIENGAGALATATVAVVVPPTTTATTTATPSATITATPTDTPSPTATASSTGTNTSTPTRRPRPTFTPTNPPLPTETITSPPAGGGGGGGGNPTSPPPSPAPP